VDPQGDPGLVEVLNKYSPDWNSPITLYRGKGCKHCKQSGYWGRMGIFEFFQVDERMKRLISEKALTQKVRDAAKENLGMVSLREDGLYKVLKGMTTLEEVNRVASQTSFLA
jgi:type II secretory ATPase GspE/PulE/Tfp pilus assembly ATPase PilB-like protein